jgi:hypothetical protein
MDINEARAILKNPHATTLHESAAAASYLSSFYAHEGKPLLRPVDLTKDAIPGGGFRPGPGKWMGVNDEFREGGAEVRRDLRQSRSPERTEMGADPGGAVGPRRILRLDGPASGYQIISSADGETWLCFSGKIDGAENPARTVTGGASFIADARRRAAAEQKRNREWAAGISDFWKKQQARRA